LAALRTAQLRVKAMVWQLLKTLPPPLEWLLRC
jgi:hypothetical protein